MKKRTLSEDLDIARKHADGTVNIGLIVPFQQAMFLYKNALEYGIKTVDWGDNTYHLLNYKVIIPNNKLGFIIKCNDVNVSINNGTQQTFTFYSGNEQKLKELYQFVNQNRPK